MSPSGRFHSQFWCLAVASVASVALLLCVCSCDSDDAPTVVIQPPDLETPPVSAIEDLRPTAGREGAITLAWTVPHALEKESAPIGYDLRHIPLGSEDSDWAAWTIAEVAATDTARKSQ